VKNCIVYNGSGNNCKKSLVKMAREALTMSKTRKTERQAKGHKTSLTLEGQATS